MTKVWGFDVPCGPLQFSTKGWRDRARDILRGGDLVVLVGTKGEETDPKSRGRVLEMMEPTTEVVSALDFDLNRRAVDFDDDGNHLCVPKTPSTLMDRQNRLS